MAASVVELFRTAVPDAHASLTRSARGGHRVNVVLPAAPGPQLGLLGWKVLLACGVAADDDDTITDLSVSWSGTAHQPGGASQSSLRSAPGIPVYNEHPRVGTITVDQAIEQLESSREVMRSVFPPGLIREDRVEVVPVDLSRNFFGLHVELHVSRIEALKPALGAVVNGLKTGLVGGPDALVEGLAQTVVDEEGPRAGWFHSARLGVGIGMPGAALGGQVTPVDVEFPNLTGGPRMTHSVVSGGIPIHPGQIARVDRSK